MLFSHALALSDRREGLAPPPGHVLASAPSIMPPCNDFGTQNSPPFRDGWPRTGPDPVTHPLPTRSDQRGPNRSAECRRRCPDASSPPAEVRAVAHECLGGSSSRSSHTDDLALLTRSSSNQGKNKRDLFEARTGFEPAFDGFAKHETRPIVSCSNLANLHQNSSSVSSSIHGVFGLLPACYPRTV